jgi:hypothetical protein
MTVLSEMFSRMPTYSGAGYIALISQHTALTLTSHATVALACHLTSGSGDYRSARLTAIKVGQLTQSNHMPSEGF